jgi:hypothetical protein
VEEERVTTADLLAQWREATRAAELAERLAVMATQAADQADANALGSDQIASLAEKAAVAAERAATTARKAATRATALASENRHERLRDADTAVTAARGSETGARERYDEAERADGDRPSA